MDRSLDSLDRRFRPLAVELIAKIVEAGIAVMIVDTGRTDAEQQDALARGVSWVQHSKHQDGLAIDLVPYEFYRRTGLGAKLLWDPSAVEWARMADLARPIGLVCGYDWKRKDCGHYEMPDASV